jgi:hypothetical protein
MEPVYARLRVIVGEDGALYTYCDDSYIIAASERMADVLHRAPAKVGLLIGFSPGKTELILPQGYGRHVFSYPLDNPWIAAPHVVEGFKSCLGVP